MDAEPRITDDEIASFMNTEEMRELSRLDNEMYAQEARDIVWSTIEHLDLPVAACRNEEDDDEIIDRLVHTILENPSMKHLFDVDVAEDEKYNRALEIAEDYFEQELLIIERLAVCLEDQLRRPQDIETHTTIKKQFMADLVVERIDSPHWYTLCDETLSGDMLDIERDAEIVVEAIRKHSVEKDNDTGSVLHRRINDLLGIPDDLHTTPYTEQERLQYLQLSNLSVYIQAIIKTHRQPEDRPEREQLIDAAFREWNLQPSTEVRETILRIAELT